MKTKRVILIADEAVYALALERHGRRWEVTAKGKTEFPAPGALMAGADFAGLANAASDAARTLGKSGEAVLVLPMHWCFVQRLDASSRKSEEALAYDLEPYLPLPLEEVTCAFLSMGTGQPLGVAIPTEPASRLLEALADAGVEIDHVAVDTLACLEAIDGDDQNQTIVILDSHWVRAATSSPNALACSAVLARRTQEQANVLRDSIRQRLAQNEEAEGSVLDLGTGETATAIEGSVLADAAAERVAIGAASSTPDLRTGELSGGNRWQEATRLAGSCLTLLIVLLGLAIGGVWMHERGLQGRLRTVQERQLQVYRTVYADSPLPPGAALRLASERLRLEGLTRGDKGKSRDHRETPALELLREAVASLPPETRIMITDLRIEGSQLLFHGKTAEHRDAEQIAEALGSISTLQARPPRTSRLSDGAVEFSIHAELGDAR